MCLSAYLAEHEIDYTRLRANCAGGLSIYFELEMNIHPYMMGRFRPIMYEQQPSNLDRLSNSPKLDSNLQSVLAPQYALRRDHQYHYSGSLWVSYLQLYCTYVLVPNPIAGVAALVD